MKAQVLLEAAKNGIFDVKISEDGTKGSIGDSILTLDQADKLVRNYGWLEYVLSPFEIMRKTDKFVKSLDKYMNKQGFWNNVDITFQNRHSQSYKRTFDRICLITHKCTLAILYNMENVSGKYVIYNMDSLSSPIAKCRNIKAVAEFLNDYNFI
jgi:hypothetical protein